MSFWRRAVPLQSAVVLLAAAAPPAGAAAPPSGIQRVAWLQGCWEAAFPDRMVEERWMPPRGGTMLGVSRTVRGNQLAEYELVVLRERGEQLAYEAHPSGQPGATFLSDSVSDSAVVFVNPGHDFPKRIGYERTGDGQLLAWIDGGADSERPRIDYPFKRVACEERAAPPRGPKARSRRP